MSILRRFVPLSLLVATAVMLPQAALAHDELISSDPDDGDTVEAPDELTLTFSGQIAEVGAAVVVTDDQDDSVTDGEPEVDGTAVVQDLADDLAAGDYEVVWRVTSEDGHPISGTFSFAVEGGAAAAGDDAAQSTTEEAEATSEEAEVTSEEVTEEPTADPTTEEPAVDADEATTVDDEASGVPVWAWVVIGLGVAGLAALLARTWSRGRS